MTDTSAAPNQELLVRSMTWEAEDVLSLRLETTGLDLLPEWKPGAHVDVILGAGLERQYSLCGDPADRTSWRIAVRKEPESRGGSLAIHTAIRPGQLVTVRGPRNHFHLVDATSYLFIAGGIGITPILPMVRQVASTGKDWRLVYGGRHAASMPFLAELEAYGSHVDLYPQDRCGLVDLAAALRRPKQHVAVFACGPEPMLLSLEQLMEDWPPDALHVERFKPKQALFGSENSSFELILARSGRKISVGADQTILGALEEAGISPLFSCREGTCGTCETTILDGDPDHRDSILSDTDRNAHKTMMICVSRAHSPEIVLDI